jgi:FixJ family two-component response regulator
MTSPAIYLIDNDAAVRVAMRRLLLPLRVPVRAFATAEQFLREVERGAEGCLILDVSLPGMTGLQLQELLNGSEWRLPVVFTTGHDDDQTRDVALRRGAIAYLRKPFDCDVLLAAVRFGLASPSLPEHRLPS